jgi:sugar transferase (PEP-CTERM/EpsH1 system associated)
VRVLYLCHRIPYPPNKGDKIRAFYELQAIAGRHEVDVFTLADDEGDLAFREPLLKHCRNLTVAQVHPKLARLQALPFLLTRKPLTLPYFHSRELETQVRRALEGRSYDRIFVYCSAMAQYVGSAGQIPVLMDFVDVDSDKWTQYASFTRFPFSAVYRREGRCLEAFEREACGKSTSVVVTTEREARLLRRLSPEANVHVIPNGVDTVYFDPAAVPRNLTTPAMVFTGDMSYFPNQEAVRFFATQVLPLIQASVPNAHFLIVGRNPGPGILQLRKTSGVEVTGFVPDVRTYLAKAHVAVAPFAIAAGIQNKILEAMAFGLPVVATSRTAQGLSPTVSDMVDTADTAEEFAAKIVLLLRNPELANRKGLESRCRVAAEYRWDHSCQRLLELLENPWLIGSPKHQGRTSCV